MKKLISVLTLLFSIALIGNNEQEKPLKKAANFLLPSSMFQTRLEANIFTIQCLSKEEQIIPRKEIDDYLENYVKNNIAVKKSLLITHIAYYLFIHKAQLNREALALQPKPQQYNLHKYEADYDD